MRTLLALTALMLLLATAVWWKTRPAEDPITQIPTTLEDPLRGVVTMGVQGDSKLAEASFPTEQPPVLPSDADGDHEGNTDAAPANPPVMEPEPTPDPVIEIPQEVRYTVKSGDTLYRILMRTYGTAPEELVDAVAEANAMSDPSALEIGQELLLPAVSGFQTPQRP
ncbi:MAG: LysM peptidoglycan-binding domain-containing protein [Planctomycetota bacterium]|jgi:nucleoid-associated protein YgaU